LVAVPAIVMWVIALAALVLLALAVILAGCYAVLVNFRQADPLEELGVRATYPHKCLPVAKIDCYYEMKDRMRSQYVKDSHGSAMDDDHWMSRLPPQAKEALKYQLMQRAIGDMAALQKIDADARGYWRLFSKGVITSKFWNSVVEAERELSLELESVKAEAARVEPTQDPQGIISEAMQFVVRYGDKLPSAADVAGSADAIADLMRHLPPPGQCPPGMLPPGYPGAGPLGQMMRPAGAGPPQATPSGGVGEAYTWRQDGDEIELSVTVPSNATKGDIKVVFQPRAVEVEHKGTILVEGQLAGLCRPEGSTWTLSKGRVVISLEKADPRPWQSLLVAGKS